MELLKAPERGMLYALYTDRMEYRPYEREDLLLKEKDLQKTCWNCICLMRKKNIVL